jgi:uncharacterized membrane protein
MELKVLISALVVFLHDFFTVVWIGGLAFMVLVMVPALKKGGQEKSLILQISKSVMRRFRGFVIVSIVVLTVTGVLLSKQSPNEVGFMRFTSLYSGALSIKHILMILMLILVVFKNTAKRLLQNLPMFSITVINFVLGSLVLLLSAFTSVL